MDAHGPPMCKCQHHGIYSYESSSMTCNKFVPNFQFTFN